MCGIAGVIGGGGDVRRMAAALARRKMGFSPPLASWLRGELRPLLEASIASLCRRGLLDAAELRRLLAEHLSGAADHRDRLFLLLTLDLWLNR